jgi:hypothetical protein
MGYAKSRVPSEVEVERLVRRVSAAYAAPPPVSAVRKRLYSTLSFAAAVACGGLAWAGFGKVLEVLVPSKPTPSVSARASAAPEPVAKRRTSHALEQPPVPAESATPAPDAPVAAPPVPAPASAPPSAAFGVGPGPSARIAKRPSASEADDLETLAQARHLLASDPARAFALTEASARESPQSRFSEERAAIGIEALERLGRRSEAEQRLAAFERSYPTSPYRRRLRSGLEQR